MPFLIFSLITMVVAVVSAIVFAFFGHGLGTHSAETSLLLGFLAGAAAAWCFPKKTNQTFSKKNFWEWSVIIIFILASARAFLWLSYNDGNLIKVLSPNNLGDLSLHIALIRYLAVTPHWWPMSPILIHEPLRYSIGIDLFNSLLLLVGVPLQQGLIWMGLLGAILTGMALWHWGRGFVMAAFLFNGGLAGILFFQGMDPDSQVAWKNLFLSMFVTQRGFLYALPAGLILLTSWRTAFFSKTEEKKIPRYLQVILLGAMPLFSVHNFLFLAAMMTGIAVIVPQTRKELSLLALLAWPWALLTTWLVSGGGGDSSFLGWHPGWMQEGNPLCFWFWNFGISLPLCILLVLFSDDRISRLFSKFADADEAQGVDGPQKVSAMSSLPAASTGATKCFAASVEFREQSRAFVWPAAAIFTCCLLIRFAPWPWDNMKLMMWSWLVIAPFLWELLIKPKSYAIRIVVCFLLFASGIITLLSGLDGDHGYEIAARSELNATVALIHNLPLTAVLATAPEYNHPVLMLGHPVVAGYEGHLWSHGLSYQKRLALLKSIMMGEPDWETKARTLGVSAIYWSNWEQEAFPNSQLPFAHAEHLPLIYKVKAEN